MPSVEAISPETAREVIAALRAVECQIEHPDLFHQWVEALAGNKHLPAWAEAIYCLALARQSQQSTESLGRLVAKAFIDDFGLEVIP